MHKSKEKSVTCSQIKGGRGFNLITNDDCNTWEYTEKRELNIAIYYLIRNTCSCFCDRAWVKEINTTSTLEFAFSRYNIFLFSRQLVLCYVYYSNPCLLFSARFSCSYYYYSGMSTFYSPTWYNLLQILHHFTFFWSHVVLRIYSLTVTTENIRRNRLFVKTKFVIYLRKIQFITQVDICNVR